MFFATFCLITGELERQQGIPHGIHTNGGQMDTHTGHGSPSGRRFCSNRAIIKWGNVQRAAEKSLNYQNLIKKK